MLIAAKYAENTKNQPYKGVCTYPQNHSLNIEIVLIHIRAALLSTDGLLHRNLWTD